MQGKLWLAGTRKKPMGPAIEQKPFAKHFLDQHVSLCPAARIGKLTLTLRAAALVLSNLGMTGIDSLRKSRVSVPGVDGSSPAKKSIKQQLATIRTPWLPSSELSTAIVPLG
jgi:hypothetical protein